MKLSIPLPILLMAILPFPALSQDIGSAILSEIISSSGSAQPANIAGQGLGGVLDLIGSTDSQSDKAGDPANPLDYVSGLSNEADPFSELVDLYSKQGKGAGLGVLDVISGAYNSNGFYATGVFDSMDFSQYETASSVIAPMSGMSFYSPEWGQITSGFGYRPQFKRMHKGIDVAMNVGDTVRAALPGIVERVAYEAKGYGHYIIVKHDNGMETRYAHLSMPIASPGQRVMAGQPIALSGNTGNSTGPHLHFETRYNGEAIDPGSVFNFHGNQQAASYMNSPLPSTDPNEAIATGFNGSKKNLAGKSTYVVREGDTLTKIAKRANMSVLRLCQLNFMMEDQILMPGTMLKLK